MPKVEFKRVQTDEEVENIDIKDGQLIYTGTGKTFMDYGNERIPTGSGGGSVDVDTEMSDTSENAVQNKVIKEYVDDQVSSIPEEVIISNSEPTSTGNKIWIDTGEVQNSGSELPMVYPVGSIYMSVNNTNPATLFGFGTWEQIKDTFLLSAGDTYTAGATGGEATHTLTTREIPKHEHQITWANGAYGVKNNAKAGTGSAAWDYLQLLNISQGTSLKAAQQSTGDGAHNNMPPYLVVYMWKRTA